MNDGKLDTEKIGRIPSNAGRDFAFSREIIILTNKESLIIVKSRIILSLIIVKEYPIESRVRRDSRVK